MKLRNSHDDSATKTPGIIGRVKNLTSLTNKEKNKKFDQAEQPSPYESDGSPVFDSDDSSNGSSTSSGSSSSSGRTHNAGSERFTSSETKTRLDNTVSRSWSQLSRNRSFKGLSFKTTTTKRESSITHSSPFTVCNIIRLLGVVPFSLLVECINGFWLLQ